MIRTVLLVTLCIITNVCYAQQEDDKKLYLLKDTIITGVDTINLIHTKLKVGMKLKKRFSFEAGSGDTVLYSLKKENNTRMKYRVIKPNAEEKEYTLNDDVKNMRLDTDAGAGNYELEFKNQSFKKNFVVIDLKKVRGWKRIERIKKTPPKQDSVVVIINDTIPRIVLEGTYYIGAKKNIRAESERIIEFQFVTDSVPCFWSSLVGFGREYQSEVTNLVNLKTQQPVGDALIANFMSQYQEFPYSKSKRAQMNLTGPGVNKNFNTTAHYVGTGNRGIYKLSVTNKDEVVGEYVYFKVVAFDLVKKSEKKVPISEFKKMKIAKCSSN